MPRVLAFVVLLAASVASAAEFRNGSQVSVGPGESISGDLYISGRDVVVDGVVDGDLVVAGNSVVVRGKVTGDLLGAARILRIEGPVEGSVRAAGAELVLTSNVGKDAVVAAGEIDLPESAHVEGDLVAAAGDVDVAGTVNGRSMLRAGEARLAGTLGDVRVEARALDVAPTASIGRLVERVGESTIAPGARIAATERIPAPETVSPAMGPLLVLLLLARALVGCLLFGIAVLLLVPRALGSPSSELRRSLGECLAVGVAVLAGGLSLAAIVFALGLLIGGWWVGLFVLGLLALSVPLALAVVAFHLGRFLLGRRGGTPRDVPALLLGTVVAFVAALVPIAGQLALLAAIVAGFGALGLSVAKTRHARREEADVLVPMPATRPVPPPVPHLPGPPPKEPPPPGGPWA